MDWLLENEESVLSITYDTLDHSLLDLGMVWCWRGLLGWQRQWSHSQFSNTPGCECLLPLHPLKKLPSCFLPTWECYERSTLQSILLLIVFKKLLYTLSSLFTYYKILPCLWISLNTYFIEFMYVSYFPIALLNSKHPSCHSHSCGMTSAQSL